MNYDYIIKYIIIGDSFVGKSSISHRYIRNIFSNTFEPTIGIEFSSKIINYNFTRYKIHIWDTAGQEVFNSITKSYFRNVCVAFIVFSFDNINSIINIRKWLNDLKENNNDDIIIYIVGNKCEFKKNDINLENYKNLKYFEVSAKKNIKINELFEESVKDVELHIKNNPESQMGIKKNIPSKSSKYYCC